MIRKAFATVLLAAAGTALSACGEVANHITAGGAAQPVSLMLDYLPNADHVGIYRAMAERDFAAAGLSVTVQAPSDPAEPLKLLAAGKVDLAISYEPELILARDKGLPLVSVAALVQQPLTSLISLRNKHVSSAAQLHGKTVGDAGIPYQQAYLQTILANANVDRSKVREVNVGFNLVPAMLSGRVDATLGAFWNYEAIQLRQQGRHPVVLRMPQLGVPNYDELVLVTRSAFLFKHADVVRRFAQALARGYRSARADPRAAVGDLTLANPSLDPTLQLASVNATMSSFFPADAHPWGWQNQGQWNAYGEWMLTHHLINHSSAVVDASTNELLAGQGI